MTSPTVKLSLNFEVQNKDVQNYTLLAKAKYWKPTEVNIDELCSHIGAGYSFMPSLIDARCDRKKEHCNHAEVLAIDIDRGMSIEEALAHDFIKQHCWLAYTSPSHSDEQHKFRLVFRLPKAVTGHEAIERCIAYLLHLIPQSDGACKDSSRFYYGSTSADFFIQNEEAVLGDDFTELADRYIERQEQEKAERAASNRQRYETKLQRGDFDGQDELAEAMHALSFIPPRVPGTGTYPLCRDVLWSLCDNFGIDEAIRIMQQHSPDTTPSDWCVERIARQFKPGAGITKATLFGMAKKLGYCPVKKSLKKRQSSKGKQADGGDGEGNTQSDEFEGGKPHFWSTPQDGLIWESFEQDTKGQVQRSLTKVGNHLEAIAYVNSPDGDGAAIVIEFKNQRGLLCQWTMPRRALGADSGALIGELLARGYGLVYEQKRKFARYLTELGSDESLRTFTVTDKTGWIEGAFVLPNHTYGSDTLRFREMELKPVDCPLEKKGTLDGWRSEVAAKCAKNSRLIFTTGTAFAAPLLHIAGLESGGFHLVGGTSQGKTTALTVAASVSGVKQLPHWRTTANGLESTATAHNHQLLLLDEIGQAEAKDVGATAYMLANGQGKARMRRDLTRSTPKTWGLIFLSSGEVGLEAYLKQAGISVKGGQEVRLPDLPAIPQNSQYGVFESIGEFETPVQFVTALESATRTHRGTALDEYLTRLVVDNQQPDFAKQVTDKLFAIAGDLSKGYTDTAISRVSKRFALVQVALELAHRYGLLPFPIEQISWAVKTMFTDWVNARGGDGSIEIRQALERIEHLFVANEFSDRVYQVDISEKQTIRNLLAYRKKDDFGSNSEYWVPPAIFDRELAIGVDRAALITELQKKGWLKEPDAEGKNSLRRHLNGKRQRFYVFTQFWSNEKSGVPGVPGVPLAQDAQPEPISDGTPRDTLGDTLKNEVSHDCTEFDTTRDTLKNEVSHKNVPGVPDEMLTQQGIQGDGTHGTHGTPQKHKVGNQTLEIGTIVIDRKAKYRDDRLIEAVTADGRYLLDNGILRLSDDLEVVA